MCWTVSAQIGTCNPGDPCPCCAVHAVLSMLCCFCLAIHAVLSLLGCPCGAASVWLSMLCRPYWAGPDVGYPSLGYCWITSSATYSCSVVSTNLRCMQPKLGMLCWPCWAAYAMSYPSRGCFWGAHCYLVSINQSALHGAWAVYYHLCHAPCNPK